MDSKEISFPVIDFSSLDLKQGGSTWESVKVEVRNSLEEFGCFHAVYGKVSKEIRKALFDSLAELFDLPLQEKARSISGKVFDGYTGPDPGRPLYESLGINTEMVDLFTVTIWPQGKSTFSKTVECYIEQLSALDRTIRRMILESLGLEKYEDEHMDSTDYNIRFMKYKAPHSNGSELGLLSHADKNLVTVLDQHGAKGLQVLTKDGQWMEVNFFPNSFFVFTGETFHAWTNGRLHAPRHRVMMTGNDTRYTIGLFSNYKPDYMVNAPKELVDEDHPQLYKPFDVSGLIAFYKEGGWKLDESTIKAYAGI